MPDPILASERAPLVPLIVRCLLGGTLMGLANLVPGISGGTMLLAAGVYPLFVEGIAEVTTLHLRARTLITLGAIAGAAIVVILLLAGAVKGLVVDHRWIMYSLFIGLTLGGVPVVWKLLRPMNAKAIVGCLAGIAVMAAMALIQPGAAGGAESHSYGLLLLAGTAGASAMILPGVSGGYLLLILGQYIPILGAIDAAKTGAAAGNWAQVWQAMHVFVPVGVGVLIGIVAVSNLVKILLERYQKPTLGLLLGLLLGAVLGLWPFQQGTPPAPGVVINGQVMTPERIAALDPKYYPLERFTPSAAQVGVALALVCAGFAATLGIARIGGKEETGAENA